MMTMKTYMTAVSDTLCAMKRPVCNQCLSITQRTGTRSRDEDDDPMFPQEEAAQVLAEHFLPSLFGDEDSCDAKRQLACLPVNHTELTLSNPLTSTGESIWKV